MHVVLDLETTGLSRFKNNISIFGMFVPEYDYYVQLYDENISAQVDKRQSNIDDLDYSNLYERIKCELNKLPKKENGEFDVCVVTQNGKFDTLFLYEKTGIMLPINEDVMLEQYVLHMGTRKGLDYIVYQEFGEPTWDIPLKEKHIATPKSVEYHKKDLYWTWKCHQSLREQIKHNTTFERLYTKLVIPTYLAYRKVEQTGIFFNEDKYHQVYKDYQEKYNELETYLISVKDINWGSSKQVGDFLYKECLFPIVATTEKGAPSTDATALQKLADMGYEIASKLKEYKFYKQSINTFLKPWGEQIHNHRIYPTFNIDTVRTGRTSSSDPNLQQVPRDINLRSIFTAPEGYHFYEIDHSQLELRIAAHIMNEPNMIQAYKNGEDLHTRTARSIVGHDPSKTERTMAKPVNFGFLYGMQASSFPAYAYANYGLHFTEEQGKIFRDAFFKAYPKLLDYYRIQENTCKDPEVGGAYTMFGRFRALPELFSNSWGIKQSAIRQCINTPTQSAGSDILLSGMLEIQQTFPEDEVRVVGTVHDSILLEVKADDKEKERYNKIEHILENPQLLKEFGITLRVPLKIDGESCGNITTGTGWGAGH